jgi:threonine/homoserine/homoserine lactone efflux protein
LETIFKLSGVFVTAFVVGLSGAMMPGPLLAVTIGEASRRGVWAGPLIVVGHMILELALVLAVIYGAAGFLTNAYLITVVGFVGGAVMCWMGQGMVRSARTISLNVEASGSGKMHPVTAGIVVSLSNPYWTIWWATIGLTYLMMGFAFGTLGIVAFFVGHILSDFAWYSLVSLAAAKGKNVLSESAYRRLIGICGAALFIFGLWFFWKSGVTIASHVK